MTRKETKKRKKVGVPDLEGQRAKNVFINAQDLQKTGINFDFRD